MFYAVWIGSEVVGARALEEGFCGVIPTISTDFSHDIRDQTVGADLGML